MSTFTIERVKIGGVIAPPIPMTLFLFELLCEICSHEGTLVIIEYFASNVNTQRRARLAQPGFGEEKRILFAKILHTLSQPCHYRNGAWSLGWTMRRRKKNKIKVTLVITFTRMIKSTVSIVNIINIFPVTV